MNEYKKQIQSQKDERIEKLEKDLKKVVDENQNMVKDKQEKDKEFK